MKVAQLNSCASWVSNVMALSWGLFVQTKIYFIITNIIIIILYPRSPMKDQGPGVTGSVQTRSSFCFEARYIFVLLL